MSLFTSIIKKINDVIDRHDSQNFMKGVMAACAIVANADNKITFAEWVRLDEILAKVDRLKIYDPHDAIDLFNKYVKQLQGSDRKSVKEKLLKQIGKTFVSESDQVVLIKVCWAISKADGKVDHFDYDAVEEIAKAIHVDFRKLYSQF
jgi:tellurite resistance protein